MVMMKVAAAAKPAPPLPQATVARPLPPVVAVHRTALQVAAGRAHLPGTAIQVLRETATPDNNAMPADSSPAGAAVRVTAAGPIPVIIIATAAAIAAAVATAVTANHS
jgi:hypothetical protein